jgi:hypothetical protein
MKKGGGLAREPGGGHRAVAVFAVSASRKPKLSTYLLRERQKEKDDDHDHAWLLA